MKKLFMITLLSVVLFGCKTNTATQLDFKKEVALKGNWILTAVSYPGSEYIKVNSFDIADSQCFVGSTWKFVSNNNKGQMALSKEGCPLFNSAISWLINKDGNFVMKLIDAGEKAKRVKEGYVLKLANQSENSFQLVDRINVGGSMADVVYQFQKTN